MTLSDRDRAWAKRLAFERAVTSLPSGPWQRRDGDHRADNLDRLRRAAAGDVTDRCYWCGDIYVNTGDFPYCSKLCAVAAEQDG